MSDFKKWAISKWYRFLRWFVIYLVSDYFLDPFISALVFSGVTLGSFFQIYQSDLLEKISYDSLYQICFVLLLSLMLTLAMPALASNKPRATTTAKLVAIFWITMIAILNFVQLYSYFHDYSQSSLEIATVILTFASFYLTLSIIYLLRKVLLFIFKKQEPSPYSVREAAYLLYVRRCLYGGWPEENINIENEENEISEEELPKWRRYLKRFISRFVYLFFTTSSPPKTNTTTITTTTTSETSDPVENPNTLSISGKISALLSREEIEKEIDVNLNASSALSPLVIASLQNEGEIEKEKYKEKEREREREREREEKERASQIWDDPYAGMDEPVDFDLLRAHPPGKCSREQVDPRGLGDLLREFFIPTAKVNFVHRHVVFYPTRLLIAVFLGFCFSVSLYLLTLQAADNWYDVTIGFADDLQDLVGQYGVEDEWVLTAIDSLESLASSGRDSLYSAGALGLLISCLIPILTFQYYKKSVIELRCGKPAFQDDLSRYTPYATSLFVGSYLSFVCVGYILFCICFWLVILSFAWEPVRHWLVFDLADIWVPMLIGMLVASLIVKKFIYNSWLSDGENIKHAQSYSLIDVLMTFALIPASAWAAIMRVCYVLIYAVLSISRIDLCVLPIGFESFDSGFSSFAAVLLMSEERFGPVQRVALKCLLQCSFDASKERHTVKYRSILKEHEPTNESEGGEEVHEAFDLLQQEDLDDDDGDDHGIPRIEMQEISVGEEERKLKKKIIRNRFWLYYILTKNPKLCWFRKRRIVFERERAEKLEKQREELEKILSKTPSVV